MSERPLRVLIVDDSAFARKVLREVLRAAPGIDVVGFARDGLDALEKIVELTPDVITLDLVMPELDGVGVLAALRSMPSPPRAVVVTMSDAESVLGVAALQGGAFDVVHKPTALATDRLYELGDELVQKVRLAGAHTAEERPPTGTPAAPATVSPRLHATQTSLVVIGASTGGPRAVTEVLKALPASLPVPVAIVVHMPPGYTGAFAERLDRECPLHVVEAREGLPLAAGTVAIARAGMHLVLRGSASSAGGGDSYVLGLDVQPIRALHRPSVDVLFASAAGIAGARTLGVVLTGMGSDGVDGARAIRAAGGRVIVEHARTCIVHGMPRAVAAEGLAEAEIPIDAMGPAIVDRL